MNDNDLLNANNLPINSNLFGFGKLKVCPVVDVIRDGSEDGYLDVKSECKLDINSLLKELSMTGNTDAKEDLDLVVEFIRRRLELVFDNPDLVHNLKLLENLDKLCLSDRVRYLEDKISILEENLTQLSNDYDRLVDSLKQMKYALGNI